MTSPAPLTIDDLLRIKRAFDARGPVAALAVMNHAGLELLHDELTPASPETTLYPPWMGLPIRVDNTLPRDVIRFEDGDGNAIRTIRLTTETPGV